jgi:hypothetical protein
VLSLTSKKTRSSVDKTEWENWAQHLRRWGLSSLVAAFLEAGGAFATLAAQSLYVAQPMLEPWMPEKSLSAIAAMLADPQQSEAFAQSLREQAK